MNKKLSVKTQFLVLGGFFLLLILMVVIGGTSNTNNSVVIPSTNQVAVVESLSGIQSASVTSLPASKSAKYVGSSYSVENFIADGKNTMFLLRESYDDITVRVSGHIVGIATYNEGLSCESEACYDFSGKKLVFKTAPSVGTQITFTGISSTEAEKASSKQTSQTWTTVKSWSGNSSKTTEPFEIDASPWKIKWLDKDVYSAGASSIFQVYVVDAKTNTPVDVPVNAHAGSDETFIYQAGTFYLKIIAANGEWSLSAQELH